MKNIEEFLYDSEQAKLRKLAQLQNERFENTLDSYKELFIANFFSVLKTPLDKELIKYKQLEQIKGHLLGITKVEIEEIFSKLKNIYLKWLQSDSVSAVNEFKEILISYNLTGYKRDISNEVLFRGRWKNSVPFNKYDMFHIPYDKRFLIDNQRYSLPGIPFLYLGTSVYDVTIELDCDLNEIEKLMFSYFYIKNEAFEVFDFTNGFYEHLKESTAIFNLLTKEEIEYEEVRRIFFKLILSSICSFEKTKLSKETYHKFHEEYILPQVLTQALINLDFKGILYSSTKLSNIINDKHRETSYKNNVAIFTSYNGDRHYDVELYNKFLISHPLSFDNLTENQKINESDIKELLETLESLKADVKFQTIGFDFLNKFAKIQIKEQDYFKHNIGQLHLFMLYSFLIIEKNKLIISKEGDSSA